MEARRTLYCQGFHRALAMFPEPQVLTKCVHPDFRTASAMPQLPRLPLLHKRRSLFQHLSAVGPRVSGTRRLNTTEGQPILDIKTQQGYHRRDIPVNRGQQGGTETQREAKDEHQRVRPTSINEKKVATCRP